MQNRRERLLLVLVPTHRAVRIAALVPHLPWALVATPKVSPPLLSRAKSSSRSLVLTEPPASVASKRASCDREGSKTLPVRLGAVNLVQCTPFTKVVRDVDSGDDMLSVSGPTRSEADRQVHSTRTRRTEVCENTRVLDPKAQHQGHDDKRDLNQAIAAIARASWRNVDPVPDEASRAGGR